MEHGFLDIYYKILQNEVKLYQNKKEIQCFEFGVGSSVLRSAKRRTQHKS
jgi:hypothetical protein